MNFKSIALVGLSLAAVGLSLPARADDTATVVDSQQTAITTGSFNDTSIKNRTRVDNEQKGSRRNSGATGTNVINTQLSDTQGDVNSVRLRNNTDVNNSRRTTR